MIITSIAQVNAIGCDPCPWPTCPEPGVECQSMSRSAAASDDDYLDELAEWTAATAAHAAWEAADPETRGDEPPDAGEEPTPPEDYDEVEHGSWAPFVKPDGADEDDLPTIYREHDSDEFSDRLTGTSGSSSGTEAESDTQKQCEQSWEEITGTDGSAGAEQFAAQGFILLSDGSVLVCDLNGGAGINKSHSAPGATWTAEAVPDPVVTATSIEIITAKASSVSGTQDPRPTCPPPFAKGDAPLTRWWELEKESGSSQSLASGTTRAAVISRARAKLDAVSFPEPPALPEAAGCESKVVSDWPKIGDFEWPAATSPSLPLTATGTATVTKSRYRLEVPAGYSTTEAPRSTFEVQWAEYFFSAEWDVWDAEMEAYEASVAEHDEWEAEDPETRGDEPEVLPEPEEEPTPPTLIAERSWTWGGDMEDAKSPWYELAIPEDTAVPGETRRVNIAVNCWVSIRFGRKPTWHGEIYNPPAEP